MADELPTGALVVVPGKDGESLHWEAKWRWRSRQVKRRLGRAHVTPRAAPLDAHHAMREAIRSHAEEVEAAKRAAERGGPVTFGRVADDWLAERRAEVRDGELKGSTVRDYASMLRRADEPLRRRAARFVVAGLSIGVGLSMSATARAVSEADTARNGSAPSPRSIAPRWERSMPASWARSSWLMPSASRRTRMSWPSAWCCAILL